MSSTTNQKPPNPVDIYVGKRLRIRRAELGLSQQDLGKSVGITSQQIQKYERGINRIAISRLYDFAQIMEVPPEWFLAGYDDGEIPADTTNREIITLIKTYHTIPKNTKKHAVKMLRLITEISEGR